MSKNPLVNALAAAGYVLLVALFISFVPQFVPEPTFPLGPIVGFLTLFVFSAAIMGYIVIGMPLRMFLEGEKKEAVALFMKTLIAFALLGAVLFLLTFLIPPGMFGEMTV